MTDTLTINKSLSEEEIYCSLIPQIENLITSDEAFISNLSNFTAALKDSFEKISWVGFYLLKNDVLILGPFQGKVACTRINLEKGVCGASVSKKMTIVVENVDDFPGHIACDSGSRSEIVIPLIKGDKILGVLDLDSYEYSAFNETDKIYLERICNLLMIKLDFEKIHTLLN
jgi:L-methionine (R)-S-oxide reductase